MQFIMKSFISIRIIKVMFKIIIIIIFYIFIRIIVIIIFISDKAGVVDEDVVSSVCDVASLLACQKQGNVCTAVQTGCSVAKDPLGTVGHLLGSLHVLG